MPSSGLLELANRSLYQGSALTSERDQAIVLARERSEENQRLIEERERERQRANAAHMAALQDRLRHEAQSLRLAEQVEEPGALRRQLEEQGRLQQVTETAAAVTNAECDAIKKY